MTAVVTAVKTSCGTISRSESQTAWTVQCARYRLAARTDGTLLAHLADDDIVWLLLMGWEP